MNQAPLQYTRLVGKTAKYPYLVGVCAGVNLFGSGILVGPGLVLTCDHVRNTEEARELVLDVSLNVITPRGRLEAQVQAADPLADLALIGLAQPVSYQKPRFSDLPLAAATTLKAVGVQEPPGHSDLLTVAETDLRYANTNDASGEVLDIQLRGGARPGYSGGPVVEGTGGVIGVIRCGGPWAYSSNAVGLARIRAFLKEYMPLRSPTMVPLDATDLRQLETMAMRGDPNAQYRLALVYADPANPRHDPEAAAHWLRSAAEQGHAESAFRLAVACRRGEGVLRNESEALRWFRKAAKLSHPGAQTLWGMMLLDGRAGEKSACEAARMFEQAASQGDMEARYQLALLQLEGAPGMARNECEAMEGFRQLAETGHSDAQYKLAWMLASGCGAPTDSAEALRWAEAAAAQHHQEAQFLLDDLHRKGNPGETEKQHHG